MLDEEQASLPKETLVTPEQFSLKREYERCIKTLSQVGVVSILPEKMSLGVVGFDGKEYPIPSGQEITHLFEANEKLVTEKMKQGFTKLQLTPFAMPLAILKERVKSVILKHVREGKIFQAKRKGKADEKVPDIPIRVNLEDPFYIWDSFLTGEQNGNLVYFPKVFGQNHHGMTKDEVTRSGSICCIPGWSIQLTQDSPFLTKDGEAVTKMGRKQLENNHSPNEYLQTFSQTPYQGETGFTPEDFLINFLTRLEETNQVSYDWDDYSGAWLLGAYLPQEGCVAFGYCYRSSGRLHLIGGYSDSGATYWGAPSTVRLKP